MPNIHKTPELLFLKEPFLQHVNMTVVHTHQRKFGSARRVERQRELYQYFNKFAASKQPSLHFHVYHFYNYFNNFTSCGFFLFILHYNSSSYLLLPHNSVD